MHSLLSLPPELLRMICSNLNIFELEHISKINDPALYAVVQRLAPPNLLKWMKNARYILEVFTSWGGGEDAPLFPQFPGVLYAQDAQHPRYQCYHIPLAVCEMLDLDIEKHPYVHSDLPPLSVDFGLNGSFDWLPEDAIAAPSLQPSKSDDATIGQLMRQIRRAGLTPPAGLEMCFREARLPPCPDADAAAEGKYNLSELRKWPEASEVDVGYVGGDGGYAFRFWDDLNGDHYLIYLDTDGHECVLRSNGFFFEDTPNVSEDEDASNMATAAHARPLDAGLFLFQNDLHIDIVAFSFEEFLFRGYFELKLSELKPGLTVSHLDDLKRYVKKVFRSPLELEDQRGDPLVEEFISYTTQEELS